MKNRFWLASIGILALAGCSDGVNNADLSVSQSALTPRNFGETGGAPWAGGGTGFSFIPGVPVQNGYFGNVTAIGDFRNYASDIVVSQSPLALAHGRVHVMWGGPDGPGGLGVEISRPGDELDSFGYDIEIGNFCAGQFLSKRRGDMMIASMPTSGDKMQGGIAMWGWNRSWKLIRELEAGSDYGLAGTALATGDVNGDGKLDLIYASMPLTESYDYLPGRVSVALDICNRYGGLPDDASVWAGAPGTNFGGRLEVASLNGTDEIIVVDDLYTDGASGLTNGAVYFYKMVDGVLVPSRPVLYGTDGAPVSDVAFSDVDKDGDLDLIVGQPLYAQSKKREGRVAVLRNNGAGTAFSFDDMAWSVSSGHGGARLGSSVKVADVNHDGRDDLIVGAPGFRASDADVARAQGYVDVYLGVAGGRIFSDSPYWHYISDVSTLINDDFGRSIAVGRLDRAGWDDIVIGAPYASTDAAHADNIGRVDYFISDDAPCYTADGCMIGNRCYEAGAHADDSVCQICDPERDNFSFSLLECQASENECVEAVCDDALGCVENTLKNGTRCGESTCADNVLTAGACLDGICRRNTENCGNYRCSSEGVLACMSTCGSDNDCYAGSCVDGACVVQDDAAPVIVVSDYPSDVVACTDVTLNASQSYDADGGEVSFMWWSPDVDFRFETEAVTSSVTFKAPCKTGTFTMHLAVVDDEGLTSTRDFVFNSVTAPVSVARPESGARLMTRSLDVSGAATPHAGVDVVLVNSQGNTTDARCRALADDLGSWTCRLDAPTTIPAGNYTIRATATVGDVPMTLDIPVELAADAATDDNGDLQASCSVAARTPQSAWWMALAACFALLLPLRRRSALIKK